MPPPPPWGRIRKPPRGDPRARRCPHPARPSLFQPAPAASRRRGGAAPCACPSTRPRCHRGAHAHYTSACSAPGTRCSHADAGRADTDRADNTAGRSGDAAAGRDACCARKRPGPSCRRHHAGNHRCTGRQGGDGRFPIPFTSQSADLSDVAKSELDRVAKNINDKAMRQVELRAFASGADPESRKIALARALVVRSYLIDRGVKSRIEVGGYAGGDCARRRPRHILPPRCAT